jgi:hypothetical protein
VAKTTTYEIGKKIPGNRLSFLNNLIPLDWFNLSYVTYKLESKGNSQEKNDCKEKDGTNPAVSKC